ncbi:HNH endonuclease [Periweissella fabalis]|uniref:Putative HNH nuclease YajD n=1 Tax=Periweissella fabalis TaxID=1070421 RepID=A0A7X6N3C5_9LACO|nr:HNH endonuclease [Periweissella fabalis]MCM0598311.1 HNH endonuclease [Periweissella fabalis]NKZ24943.1 HNH endonuclease [Periweissella fabalis]
MPRVKYCNHKGCQVLVPASERWCDKHKPKFDVKKVIGDERAQAVYKRMANKEYNENKRDQDANKFYNSSSWRQIRGYVVARDMNTCQVCGNVNTNRKIVDHIHRLKSSGDERLDTNNLWTLCYKCHDIKTTQEQQIEQRSDGENVLKNATKDWWKFNIQHEIDRRKHTSQNRF